MKIIWFNRSLEQSGGGERLSLEVIRSCKELGHEVNYLTYSYDSYNVFDKKYDFINPIVKGETNHLSTKKTGFIKKIERIIWLRKQIKNIQPDTIFTSGTWGHVVDIYFATLLTKYNYYTHVFGSMFAFPPEMESLKYSKVFSKNFKEVHQSIRTYFDFVPITPPKSSKFKILKREINALIKYLAVRKSEKIFVLSERNQWETQKLYGRNSKVLQGAFPLKIFQHTINVNLKQNNIDSILVIGGSGPEKDNLRKLVKELDIIEKVLFVGFVNEDMLWDYYASCDVFLHLDLADFDIAPLEALAVGSKVIWSEEMDIPELENSIDGLWRVTSDPDKISDCISKALYSDITQVDLLNRKEIMKSFSWEFYTTKMLQCVSKK